MNESTKFEINVHGFSLKFEGSGYVSRIGHYVADAVGVVGEPLGYVTDRMGNWRIHQEKAAAAAMLRAKEIADEEGRVLSKPSPKFLAPWIEGASSEDIDGENISELWARLLTQTTEEFSAKQVQLIHALNGIGPREAKWFIENFSTSDYFISYTNIKSDILKSISENFPQCSLHEDHGKRIFALIDIIDDISSYVKTTHCSHQCIHGLTISSKDDTSKTREIISILNSANIISIKNANHDYTSVEYAEVSIIGIELLKVANV